MARTVRNVVLLVALLAFSEFILPSIAGAETVPFQVTSFSYIEYRGDGEYNEQDTGSDIWQNCLDATDGSSSDCMYPDATGMASWNDVAEGEYYLYLSYEDWFDTAGWYVNEPLGGVAYEVSVAEDGSVKYYLNNELVSEARFGNRLLEVHGHVARDTNENGQYDTTDEHLEGWTVYLDLNDNGALDNGVLWHFNGLDCVGFASIAECLGENVEPYMIVQHDGSFHFRNVPQGTYNVRLLVQDGWTIASEYEYLTQSGDGQTPPTWLDFVVEETEPTVTPTVSPSVTVTPTVSPSPSPTQMPEITPTEEPTPTIAPSPTPVPEPQNPIKVIREQINEMTTIRKQMVRQLILSIRSQFSWLHR